MGGGAGAGGDNDSHTPFPENVDGGGIVLLFAKTIASLYINANGETGIAAGSSGGAASGGGAGGSILINTVDATLSTVTSSGGAGGNDGAGDVGGNGSAGRNAIYYINSLTGSTTPAAYTSKVPGP